MRNRLRGIVSERNAASWAVERSAGVSAPGLSILLAAGGDSYAPRTEGSSVVRDYRSKAALEQVQQLALRREGAVIASCRFLLLQS